MKTFFEKHETVFCMSLIAGYVVIESLCMESFGIADYRSVIVNTLFSFLLVWLMRKLGGYQYYGLRGVHDAKRYLYFLPLVLIATVNLWNGINLNHTAYEVVCHILYMMNVGFIEEVIFRGFLFRMVEKENVTKAIILSAVTFGIGHLVNLRGVDNLIPTLLQVCYAISIGFAFVMVFHKSKSLLPCIVTHMVVNASSIFGVENDTLMYIGSAIIIIVTGFYAFYLSRLQEETDH